MPFIIAIGTLEIIAIASVILTFLFIALLAYEWLSKAGRSESVVARVERLQQVPQELLDELRPFGQEEKKPRSLLAGVNLQPVLSRFTGESYFNNLEVELERADVPLKVSEFLIVRGVFSLFFFVLTFYVTQQFLAAFGAGLLVLFIHVPIFAFRKKARVAKFSNQLAEFLILIVNSLRAGQTFMQGAEIAATESPEPISGEFKRVLKEVNLGMPVEQSMDNMLVRVPSEDLKIVVAAYTIQRQVGGNLATIFETTADTIRQRIRIKGQIDTLTTQGKISGLLVGLLPFALGGILFLLKPDMMGGFVSDPYGKGIIGLALVMQMIGAFAIKKIVDIEI